LSEVDRLRDSNNEMQQDMAKCRERECELLSFTQMLTEKNVSVQSQLSATEARLRQSEADLTLVSVSCVYYFRYWFIMNYLCWPTVSAWTAQYVNFLTTVL